MKMMTSSPWLRGTAWLCAGLFWLSAFAAERASAFGGLWAPTDEKVAQSAAQVLFVDNPDSTLTVVVRLRFTGSAKRLAWLLPVPGTPKVGVSSSVVFERLETSTMPQYWVERRTENTCKDAQPAEAQAADGAQGPSGSRPDELSATATGPRGVAVLAQGAVGPYEYVMLKPSSKRDPAREALDWLRSHGFAADGGELLAPYLRAGQNLLAFRLNDAADSSATRPVMLTYVGELPTIPLLPSTHAAQAPMALQVWVFGPTQAIPENYHSLVLNDARIDWLTAAHFPAGTLPANGVGPFGPELHKPRNYDRLVGQAVKEAGGRAFVTELGAPASQYRSKVWSDLDASQLKTLTSQTYTDGVDAIAQAKLYYSTWDGWVDTLQETVALPKRVTLQAFAEDPARYRGQAKVDTRRFLRVLQEKVVKPVSELAELLYGTPYLTRLVSEMSPDASTIDPVFTYNPDLAQISQVRIAKQTIECEASRSRDEAPWRMVLPQDGVVRGMGLEGWPAAPDNMPFNLKVVTLSSHGAGSVVADNRAAIGALLYARAKRAGRGEALPPRPQIGVRIGGAQTVSTPDARGMAPSDTGTPKREVSNSAPSPDAVQVASGKRCSVTRVAAGANGASGLWLGAMLAMLALRRSATRTARALARRLRRAPEPATVRRAGAPHALSWPWSAAHAGLTHSSASAPAHRGARARALLPWAITFLLCCACGSAKPTAEPTDERAADAALADGTRDARALTREQLRDPESCKKCHPIHYRAWSSSMHAYSARDPVFIAMNKRGQRETNGELGDLCIKCHAPMAVVDNLSKDGLNLDELPDRQRGVSCYFCHNVTGVEGDHNAMLTLGNDTVMRGPIADPYTPHAHLAEQSDLFDDNHPRSSTMCGGCHDLVLPNGVHLERTFKEYRDGLFSKSAAGKPPVFGTCAGCHMPGTRGAAADVPGAPERLIHEHLWPGIDLPLIDFPNSAALRSAVEDCQLGAQAFSYFSLEVTPPDLFSFQLETNAGHNQPSGAAQDRRMWVEFLAYDSDGKLLDASSGNIADDESEDKYERTANDPHLLMFRDRMFDAQGKEVHMFWEAAPSEEHPEGFEASALPVASTTYIEGKHAVLKQYRATGPDGKLPARVTARLRIRAIGQDVLDDLVASGDLDPELAKRMPTLNFGAKIEWTPASGMMKTVYPSVQSDCSKYRCMLDPSLPTCR